MAKTISRIHLDDFICTEEDLGHDHFSTLLYVESHTVDQGPFYIQADPRMRTQKRNWRIANHVGHGKRALQSMVRLTEKDKYPSRISRDREVLEHDDWECITDLLALGYLETDDGKEADLGSAIALTDKGREKAAELRAAKAQRLAEKAA